MTSTDNAHFFAWTWIRYVWHQVAVWCRSNSVCSLLISAWLTCWASGIVEQISRTDSCEKPHNIQGGRLYRSRRLQGCGRLQKRLDYCWQSRLWKLPTSPRQKSKDGRQTGWALRELDRPSEDVDHYRSEIVINVVAAIIPDLFKSFNWVDIDFLGTTGK